MKKHILTENFERFFKKSLVEDGRSGRRKREYEVEDYSDDYPKPSELKKGEEYVWIMGAEPLLVTYTGPGKKGGDDIPSFNFAFVNSNGNHDLYYKSVKQYIRKKV